MLGTKKNTSNSKVLVEVGRFPFIINIETQFFKNLQRISFVKQDRYLCKGFNQKLANKE